MSDVNKVRSNAGVKYGFEDTVARQMAEEAVEIANETGSDIANLKSIIENLEAVEIYVQGTSLVINTDLVNGNEVSF